MKFNINGNEVEVDNEALSKAIEEKTETFELKMEDFSVKSKIDETKFNDNLKQEAQTAGIEIGRKNTLKGLGIEVDGAHKDDTKTLAALNGFIDTRVASELEGAKIEPDKKVEELQKDKEQLVANITDVQGRFDLFKKESELKDQNQKRINTLSSLIPDNTLNTREDTLTIMNAKLNTGFNENGVMFGVGEDGEPMKNPSNRELLPMSEVVTKFFDNNQSLLKGAKGGANGADSSGGGSKQTLVEFVEEMGKNNIPPNSPEFNATMTERQKSGLLET